MHSFLICKASLSTIKNAIKNGSIIIIIIIIIIIYGYNHPPLSTFRYSLKIALTHALDCMCVCALTSNWVYVVHQVRVGSTTPRALTFP